MTRQKFQGPTLIGMLDVNTNTKYCLFSRVDRQGTFYVGLNNPWLKCGKHFTDLSEFDKVNVVESSPAVANGVVYLASGDWNRLRNGQDAAPASELKTHR